MLLSQVLTLSQEALRGVLPEPIRSIVPTRRGVRPCPGGVRIDLRKIGSPGTEDEARSLEARLSALPGVERAEVNGVLGCVFCIFTAADAAQADAAQADAGKAEVGKADIAQIMAVVEELDTERDQRHVASAARVVDRKAHAAIRLCAGLVGAGVALAGRTVHVPRLSPLVPSALQLVDTTPKLRHELERRLGRPATDAMFAGMNLVAQTLALRPLGLFVDSLGAVGRYSEAYLGHRAMVVREAEFVSRPGAYHHIKTVPSPRPTPLPPGPLEKAANTLGPAAIASFGLTFALGRDRQQGLAALIAATPKSAKMGREAFASAVGRALGRRGALVINHLTLRRMDRLDTVVLDAASLVTDSWTIERVVPLVGDVGPDELHARLYTLVDPSDPSSRREQEGWLAEPLDDLKMLPEAEAAEWRERGLRSVGVSRQGVLVAVVGLAPQIDPLAVAIAAAAKDGCEVVLGGGDASLAGRLGIDRVVPGGPRLASSIAELQADGHGVALVSRGSRRALARADLGFGVMSPSGRVPWDAAVIGELADAHLLLSCLAHARKATQRAVWLGVGSAVAGTALVFAGRRPTVVNRALIVADITGLVSMAMGEWAGRRAMRQVLPAPADSTPWHAMASKDVLSRLKSTPQGITEAEAEQRRLELLRSERKDAEPARPSLVRASVEELANPLTPILGAGAGISAMVGSVLDAAMIAGVLGVNAFVGGAQRFDADRALRRLADATAVRVRLRRPGGHVGATADTLVPGDVIELRAGDAVPADARVIKAVGLEIDESSLTGESQLVTKTPAPTTAAAVADRSSMVYQNTTVAAGHGLAVVVATGEATEAGRTIRLAEGKPPPTGVELRLRWLGRRILPIAIGSGVVLLVADLLRGKPMSAALAPAVSLAVAAVPEGLPFVATVAELAAARRLSTRNTLVPNPSTIEALGRVDVLCFDKTGTLTEGHISLGKVSDGRLERPVDELTPELRRIVVAGLRASPKYEDGRTIPHPTDRAVVDGALRLGVAPEEGLGDWRRIDELPFEPGRGYHAVLGLSESGAPELGESGHLLSVKGAPEVVLGKCTTILRDKEIVPLDEKGRRELEEEVDRLAFQGFRVLAVAERPASGRRDLDESRIQGLCFLGFLGLADPVRPTAAESVHRLTAAGVRIVMITGDHPSTAEAIGAELGVLNGLGIMTGPEMDALDDDVLEKALPNVSVFARATPAHKVRIVTLLRKAGRVVAVTGDGANDAPAIRIADVGIALGSRATPAARSAADVVVTDDRIETIVDAIVEGRAMWSSVRDSLSILLGGNLGEIIFTVGANLLAGRNVLNARQLLLVNLLTDMAPAMAVAVRTPRAASPEQLLAEGPEVSLGASLSRDMYVRAGITATAASVAWVLGRMTGRGPRADTIALAALVSAQLMQTLAVAGSDRVVLAAALGSLGVLGLIVSVPGVSHFFGCRPLGPVGWTIALGTAAGTTLLGRTLRI